MGVSIERKKEEIDKQLKRMAKLMDLKVGDLDMRGSVKIKYYKDKKDARIYKYNLQFAKKFVLPWLVTEYKKKPDKLKPTWLISDWFEPNLKTFIKEFDINNNYAW